MFTFISTFERKSWRKQVPLIQLCWWTFIDPTWQRSKNIQCKNSVVDRSWSREKLLTREMCHRYWYRFICASLTYIFASSSAHSFYSFLSHARWFVFFYNPKHGKHLYFLAIGSLMLYVIRHYAPSILLLYKYKQISLLLPLLQPGWVSIRISFLWFSSNSSCCFFSFVCSFYYQAEGSLRKGFYCAYIWGKKWDVRIVSAFADTHEALLRISF